MIEQIFREYDIRGIFGEELTKNSVSAIGYIFGLELKKRNLKSVSVGTDARVSKDALFSWLAGGLKSAGCDVFDIGMLPTPVGYFSVFTHKFDANIMISGSHNPKEYNGFKITIGEDSFFGEELKKFGKEVEKFLGNSKNFKKINFNVKCEKYDILTPYVGFFEKEFSHLKNFDFPFVCDFANGVGGITAERICKALNLNAKFMFETPDGNFPNHHPDPSEEKNLTDLKKAIRDENFALGFGFDGDADRIAVLTKKHNFKGDKLACLFALNMKNPKILGEVKCSSVMYDFIDKIGKSFMGKTGHSNIKKAIKEHGYDLGAEVSGHIYFKERYFGFDDAIYAMVRVLELIQKGISLDDEIEKLPKMYSTDEVKFHTTDEKKFAIIENVKNRVKNGVEGLPKIKEIITIDGIRVKFDHGWALVRASNTTPVIVTRFEADSAAFKDLLQEKFMEILKKEENEGK